jgi:hypothetical protein
MPPSPRPYPCPCIPALTRLSGADGSLGANATGKSYAYGGADTEPGVRGDPFAASSATPLVGNRVWRTPSFWADEGYAALAVAESSHAAANLQGYGAKWSRSDGSGGGGGGGGPQLTWTVEGRRADLYLAPAPTLKKGVAALAALTGGARAQCPSY